MTGFLRRIFLIGCLIPLQPAAAREISIRSKGAEPGGKILATSAIQAAINELASGKGGTVRVPEGIYLTGSIHLKSNIRLYLDKDAVLLGSPRIEDYTDRSRKAALIQGRGLRNIVIEGEGTIDGNDMTHPDGEEGFRGCHTIHLRDCVDLTLRDFTITRSGNYAILCTNSEKALLRNIKIRGGHDGLHAQNCRDFTIDGCDFRTGDDSVAGCDNHRFTFTNSKFNSSCNAFRFGCVYLTVRNCEIWGPGEFEHKISKRRNMLAAFAHFAPSDRNPKYPSDHWLIEDCVIRNLDAIYLYDHERGLWMTGQPAIHIHFNHIRASGIRKPVRVVGDEKQQLRLRFENSHFAMADDVEDPLMFDISRFGTLAFKNVDLRHRGGGPAVRTREGGSVVRKDLRIRTHATPLKTESIRTQQD